MKIIYNKEDLKALLKDHHSYGKNGIKIGYVHLDVLDVEITGGEVLVTIGKENEEEV